MGVSRCCPTLLRSHVASPPNARRHLKLGLAKGLPHRGSAVGSNRILVCLKEGCASFHGRKALLIGVAGVTAVPGVPGVPAAAGVAGASCTPAYSGPPAALGLPPAGVAPGPAQSVGSQLLETLSMDLEMTKEQVEKLANQKQVIRSDRETVSQCLQLVEQLRKKITAHME